MDKCEQWAELYNIPADHMRLLYAKDTSLGGFYNQISYWVNVVNINSHLVLEFLEQLPEPTKNAEEIGFSIDFLCQTGRALHEANESVFGAIHTFQNEEDESATWYWDQQGAEFYEGLGKEVPSTPLVLPNLPTYINVVAQGTGMQPAVETGKKIVPAGFFIYSMAIGRAYDFREKPTELRQNVGVGGYALSYGCKQGMYNPSGTLWGDRLETFWEPKDAAHIQAMMDAFNERVFAREEDKAEKAYIDAAVAQLLKKFKKQ